MTGEKLFLTLLLQQDA